MGVLAQFVEQNTPAPVKTATVIKPRSSGVTEEDLLKHLKSVPRSLTDLKRITGVASPITIKKLVDKLVAKKLVETKKEGNKVIVTLKK